MSAKREELLAGADVAAELAVSQRTLDRWVKAGRFPRPIRYSSKRVWPRTTVNAWLASIRKEAGND